MVPEPVSGSPGDAVEPKARRSASPPAPRGIASSVPPSGLVCEACSQPLGVVPDDSEPLYYHLQPTRSAADHEPRPARSNLPPAAGVIVLSPTAWVRITTNVDGDGLTGLTVRNGSSEATVALPAHVVDELCYQLTLHSPIALYPCVGFGESLPGEVYPPAPAPPDSERLIVEPLTDDEVAAGRGAVGGNLVEVTSIPEWTGWCRLIVAHAGARHTFRLPQRVVAELLDRSRRQLLEAACAALPEMGFYRSVGGDRR